MTRACDDLVALGAKTDLVSEMRARAAALRGEQAESLASPSTKELLPPIPHFPSLGQECPEETDDSLEGREMVEALLARRAARMLFEAANTPIGDQPDLDLVPKAEARLASNSCLQAVRAYGTDVDGTELQELLQSRLRRSITSRR